TYDKLILSPGADPIVPDISGLNTDRAVTLHTIPDMDNIHTFSHNNEPKHVAARGAGFIGLEMAGNLRETGLDCTIIDRSEQVMKQVDKDMANIIETHLTEKSVDVILNDGLDSFSNDGKTLHLTSGKTVKADMTILAVGIKPKS